MPSLETGKNCLFLFNYPVRTDEPIVELMKLLKQSGYTVITAGTSAKTNDCNPTLDIDHCIGRKPFPADHIVGLRCIQTALGLGIKTVLKKPDFVFIRDAALLGLGKHIARMTGAKIIYDRDTLNEVEISECIATMQGDAGSIRRQKKLRRLRVFQSDYRKLISQCDGFILPQPDHAPDIDPSKSIFSFSGAGGLSLATGNPEKQAEYSLHEAYHLPQDWQVCLLACQSDSTALSRFIECFESVEKVALVLVFSAYHHDAQTLYAQVCRSPQLRERVFMVLPSESAILLSKSTDADYVIAELPKSLEGRETVFYGLPASAIKQFKPQVLTALLYRLYYGGVEALHKPGVRLTSIQLQENLEALLSKSTATLPRQPIVLAELQAFLNAV